MNHVLYYSMTGNTKKMATAIAAELGVEAKSVKTETAVPQDGHPVHRLGQLRGQARRGHDEVHRATTISPAGKVALFGTSGEGEGKEVQGMAEALKQKGAIILGSYY